jgi:hypothetical protein
VTNLAVWRPFGEFDLGDKPPLFAIIRRVAQSRGNMTRRRWRGPCHEASCCERLMGPNADLAARLSANNLAEAAR